MAIYSLEVKIISRGKGQSAVASAAYRSGEKLYDERTRQTKFYRREVQPETMILAPEHAPLWVYDRQRLWNEVENAEKRKDSQLAREIRIALPIELSAKQQEELVKSYCQDQFVNQGMIADIAIHRDDKNNPHAHIMLTTREITEEGFTTKNREWNKKEQLEIWREEWANYANRELEKAGVNEKIDHRSYEKQGLEILPTKHLGHVAHEMEKKGIRTEIGDYNRQVKEYNQIVVDLQKYREEKQQLQKQVETKKYLTTKELTDIKKATKVVRGYVTLENIEKRRGELDRWEKSIEKNTSFMNWKAEKFKETERHLNRQKAIEDNISKYEREIQSINWLNPLKYKQNKATKERAENAITYLRREHKSLDRKLSYHREKLGFSSREDFYKAYDKFENEYFDRTKKNATSMQIIREEREILTNAEKALKQGEIRKITAPYPELKQISNHMDYETAIRLQKINETRGRVVPISELKAELSRRKEIIRLGNETISQLDKTKSAINKIESLHNRLEFIEIKLQSNLHNLKRLLKSGREEHAKLLKEKESIQTALEKIGMSNKKDFQAFKEQYRESEKNRPVIQKGIEIATKDKDGISIDQLKGVIEGIHKAERMQELEKKRQKYRQNERELELS